MMPRGRMLGRWYLNPALGGKKDLSNQHGVLQRKQRVKLGWCMEGSAGPVQSGP